MLKSKLVPLLAALGIALAGCRSGEQQAEIRRLTLTGSSTVAPVAQEIAARFEQRRPEVRVEVQAGGSGRGIADAAQGLADIGMATRGLAPEEREEGLVPTRIAGDGIAIIVHKSNGLAGLSSEQVSGIYTGKIDDWSRAGGSDAPITVVHKAEGRGTLEVFLNYFGLKNSEIDADVVVGHNEQGIQTVAGDPSAIGYVSIGAAEAAVKVGSEIRMLSLDGSPAGSEALARGDYPLSRDLLLITKGEPQGLIAEFIAFARSRENHDVISFLGFVPVNSE